MKNLLQSKIDNMSPNEVLDGMFRDELTRVWNRKAFMITPNTKFVALVDLDSLKWINDNNGHRVGDTELYHLAQKLEKDFPDKVFRMSGDEFAVRSNSKVELINKLASGKNYSVGVGKTLVEADKVLCSAKRQRTRSGLRSIRGEMPPYLKK